ncbi:MAG: response regulator [Chloroflexota bacterium]
MSNAPKQILLVDDDKNLCKLLANAFQEQGFETAIALNGDAALEAFKQKPPALILLDVAMPGMNGFEVASQVRALESSGDNHTIIVIMTAHARSFQVSQEFEAGIDSYLTKPMRLDDIVAHVVNLLQ